MEERTAAYLAHRMPEARDIQVSGLYRIPGGASRETWSFDARWLEGDTERSAGFIIRRDPDASLLETDRGAEYAIYRALEGTDVPAPRALWLEPDPVWLDRPFFIMERIDNCWSAGQVLVDPRFERIRPAVAEGKMRVLGAIHALDWRTRGLEFLGVPASAEACAPDQVRHWREIVSQDAIEPQPLLTAAMDWLDAHSPRPSGLITLVHGDYRTGNFLFDRRGTIRAVLDWEMAHLGDPLEDLGWLCMEFWQYAKDGRPGGLYTHEEAYDAFARVHGFPVDREAVRWWEILGNVKMAAICLTGARSFVDGRTSEIMMAVVGRMVPPLEREIARLIGW